MPPREIPQIFANLITYFSKHCQTFLIGSFSQGRVYEVLVDLECACGEYGAALPGVITNGQHEIEALPGKLIYVL